MLVHVLVLNYSGRHLLEQCLPSVVHAAESSRHRCEVVVIDNASTDDSVAWLARQFPQVRVVSRPNHGLCSFNEVVAELDGPVAILLNNDIRLAPDAIDPLVEPLLAPPVLGEPCCFLTAPLCWQFDGRTYEGFKTAVSWHWGLVRATSLYPGHQWVADQPGLTASAGAALAVDCQIFRELGGFDPLYLPGRIEDLDFAYRGYLAGYRAHYVPRSVVYHRGMASFGKAFGRDGCDWLALRNTLLFQWKNLRHPAHVVREAVGLAVRAVADIVRAPWTAAPRRFFFLRALAGALRRWSQMRTSVVWPRRSASAEWQFFREFQPRSMRRRQGAMPAAGTRPPVPDQPAAVVEVGP
jgi:GT2 family glycosyltransferase